MASELDRAISKFDSMYLLNKVQSPHDLGESTSLCFTWSANRDSSYSRDLWSNDTIRTTERNQLVHLNVYTFLKEKLLDLFPKSLRSLLKRRNFKLDNLGIFFDVARHQSHNWLSLGTVSAYFPVKVLPPGSRLTLRLYKIDTKEPVRVDYPADLDVCSSLYIALRPQRPQRRKRKLDDSASDGNKILIGSDNAAVRGLGCNSVRTTLVPLFYKDTVANSLALSCFGGETKENAYSLMCDGKCFSLKLTAEQLMHDSYREFGTFNVVYTLNNRPCEPPVMPLRIGPQGRQSMTEPVYMSPTKVARTEEDSLIRMLKEDFPPPNDSKCAVCLSAPLEFTMGGCGHCLCRECVVQLLDRHKRTLTCHICKAKALFVHKIFIC